MDINEKLELIKRNTEEILTEEELAELLRTKKQPVVYCGYEPYTAPHLGNMVTTTKLMDLKKAGFKVIFLLADMHAYTNLKASVEEINRQCEIWEKAIKAFGLDAEFVQGSSFQFKKEYWMDIINMALAVSVNRGLRAMQELSRDMDNAKISQMLYPLMQSEDVKALGCDVAVGGIDQRKVHMLAREHLPAVGWRKPICIHTPMIVSLLGAGQKMSKSIPGSGIAIDDSDELIEKNVKNAYCPAKIILDNPIIQLAKYLIFPRDNGLKIERSQKFGGDIEFKDYKSFEKAFLDGKIHPLDLKTAVARELKKIIAPARKFFAGAKKIDEGKTQVKVEQSPEIDTSKIEQVVKKYKLKAEIILHPQKAIRSLKDHLEVHKLTPDRALKCLCFVSEGKPLVAMAGSDIEIDMKKLEKVSGMKDIRMANKEELKKLFDREPGGVDPLTLSSKIPVFIDKKMFNTEFLIGSAGSPYAGLKIEPKEILKVIKAKIVNISA